MGDRRRSAGAGGRDPRPGRQGPVPAGAAGAARSLRREPTRVHPTSVAQSAFRAGGSGVPPVLIEGGGEVPRAEPQGLELEAS